MLSPLIVFGEDWGVHPSSTGHLISRMTADRKVIWVNSIGLRAPRLGIYDLARLLRKVTALFRRSALPHPMAENSPRVVDLPALPFYRFRLVRTLNGWMMSRRLLWIMRHEGIEAPILWLSLPSAVVVAGRLDERAVVYYCGDDFSALAGVDHAVITAMEKELAARADLILAASPSIVAKFPQNKTKLLPHGVDIDLFGADTQRPDDLPEERPVAGFVGTLADWIDIDLIKGVAEALPGWLFVLIGSVRTDLHGLDRMANVVLLGPRPHATLPAYLQHMDVAMLPFKDNAQIRACNPLKLREYLASGVPVATTDFPALDGYRDLVHISARTPDAFADAICKSGKEGRTRSDVRLARVAGESWTERAHRAEAWMERL